MTCAVVAEIKSNFFSIFHALAYAKRIAVFGSFARGEETPEMIIDILVKLKDPNSRPRLGL